MQSPLSAHYSGRDLVVFSGVFKNHEAFLKGSLKSRISSVVYRFLH